eukprot:337080-Amphidinium_carterae.1
MAQTNSWSRAQLFRRHGEVGHFGFVEQLLVAPDRAVRNFRRVGVSRILDQLDNEELSDCLEIIADAITYRWGYARACSFVMVRIASPLWAFQAIRQHACFCGAWTANDTDYLEHMKTWHGDVKLRGSLSESEEKKFHHVMHVLYAHELVGRGSFEPKLNFEQEAEMRQTSAKSRCYYSPSGEAQPGEFHNFMSRELEKAALMAAEKIKSVQMTFTEFESRISDHLPTGSSGQRCPIDMP